MPGLHELAAALIVHFLCLGSCSSLCSGLLSGLFLSLSRPLSSFFLSLQAPGLGLLSRSLLLLELEALPLLLLGLKAATLLFLGLEAPALLLEPGSFLALGLLVGLLCLAEPVHGALVHHDLAISRALGQLAPVPACFRLVESLSIELQVQVDLRIALDRFPGLKTLELHPLRLLDLRIVLQAHLLVFHVDGEADRVTHPELQLRLVLHKDVQLILNLKQRRVCRSCQHFDHVAQFWMQDLN